MRYFIIIAFIIITSINLHAQVEHVPVTHPVYTYFSRMEARGLLPHFSTSELPLMRNEVKEALIKIREQNADLSNAEIKLLNTYLKEFEITNRENAVVFYSPSDSTQVLGWEMLGDKDKFIYHFQDSSNRVSISPLGSIENLTDLDKNVIMGNLGFRLFGSLSNHVGYFLQVTNGAIIYGERDLALSELHKLQQNIKFADLNSDFDFSESHIIIKYDWFSVVFGRETRLLGSGIGERMFISGNSPPQDAITLNATFSNFKYTFSHAQLLASERSDIEVGFNSQFPSKYLVTHRFALRPSWGEIAFWEGLIYSKRNLDLAYLNPLSFFKSLEHALRDRDNSMMGLDITFRPIDNVQIKGSYLLDDIKFDEIGKGFWSNKTAWNIGLLYTTPIDIDFGIEYARIEPYTFTHFDSINSYTNDKMLIGTSLLPNSDEISLFLRYWWGNRYPVSIIVSQVQHGANIYDEAGNLIRNVGGDPFMTRNPADAGKVSFLDGNLTRNLIFELSAGWEFIRGYNLKCKYITRKSGDIQDNIIYVSFGFEDF